MTKRIMLSPAGVVTLDSMVTVRDVATGDCVDYMVVSPSEANVAAGRISVLAPLGTALLGYRAGAEIEWQMPGRIRRLKIHRIVQPRSAVLPDKAPTRSAPHVRSTIDGRMMRGSALKSTAETLLNETETTA